jgi:hypothetical protein
MEFEFWVTQAPLIIKCPVLTKVFSNFAACFDTPKNQT